jgi:hypothetical protein
MLMLIAVLLVSFGAAFSLIWMLSCVPNYKTIFTKSYSPRLSICKIFGSFGTGFTIIMVCGIWVGLMTAATGVNALIYHILTGMGLSLGIVFTKKTLIPKWEEQYERLCLAAKEKHHV